MRSRHVAFVNNTRARKCFGDAVEWRLNRNRRNINQFIGVDVVVRDVVDGLFNLACRRTTFVVLAWSIVVNTYGDCNLGTSCRLECRSDNGDMFGALRLVHRVWRAQCNRVGTTR